MPIIKADPTGKTTSIPSAPQAQDPDAPYTPDPKDRPNPPPKPFFPVTPNANPKPGVSVGFTEDGPDGGLAPFLKQTAERFGDKGVNRPKTLDDLENEMKKYGAGGDRISRLRLSGHGSALYHGVGQGDISPPMGEGFLKKSKTSINAYNTANWLGIFNRARFVCDCEIWLHSCCFGNNKATVQSIADASGCIVYAHLGLVWSKKTDEPWGKAKK